MSRPNLPRARTLEAAATAVFTLLVAWPFLSFTQYVSAYDTVTYSGPNLAFLFDAARGGYVPEWHDGLFGGVPFLANPSAAGLYPLKYLFLWAPADRALPLITATHLALLSAGMFFLTARALRLRPPAAFVAAVGVTGSGLVMVRSLQFEQIAVIAWVPWVLAGTELAVRGDRLRSRAVLLLALSVAMLLLAGHPQQVYIAAPLLVIWSAARAIAHGAGLAERARRVLRAAGSAGLGAVLAAPQLLMTAMQLSPAAATGGATGYQLPSDPGFTLQAVRLPTALLGDAFAGQPVPALGSFEAGAYVGMAVLLLAALGVGLLVRRGSGWPTGVALLGVAIVGGVLAAGPQCDYPDGQFAGCAATGSPYRALFTALPGFSLARVPARWSLVMVFAVVLLAAFAVDGLVRRAVDRRAIVVGGSIVLVAGILATAAGAAWTIDGNLTTGGALLWAAAAAAVLLAVGAAARTDRTVPRTAGLGGGRRRLALAGAVALLPAVAVAVELGVAATRSPARASLADAGFLRPASPIAERIGTTGDRALSTTGTPFDDFAYVLAAQRPNSSSIVGVRTVDGYDGGLWVRTNWIRAVEPLVGGEFDPNAALTMQVGAVPEPDLLARLGVRYLIADPVELAKVFGVPEPESAAGRAVGREIIAPGYGPPLAAEGTLELFENPAFESEARVVFHTRDVAAERWKEEHGKAPTSEALMRPGDPGQRFTCPAGPSCDALGATITRDRPGHLIAEATLPRPGLLVVPEQVDRGWTATVDGTDVEIQTVDGMSMGIPLADGAHRVELTYRAPGLRVGLVVTLLGVVTLGWLVLRALRRRRSAP